MTSEPATLTALEAESTVNEAGAAADSAGAQDEVPEAADSAAAPGVFEAERTLMARDTVKIPAGPRKGKLGIESEVKAGSCEVDEAWFERSLSELRF